MGLPAPKGAAQQAGQGEERGAQQEPQRRIQRADLPQQVEGLPGIIPDAQPKQQVYHTAHQKFDPGDDPTADAAALPEGIGGKPVPGAVDQPEARPAGQRHGPVGKIPPQQLQQAVACGAQGIDGEKFFCFEHLDHPLSACAERTASCAEGFPRCRSPQGEGSCLTRKAEILIIKASFDPRRGRGGAHGKGVELSAPFCS